MEITKYKINVVLKNKNIIKMEKEQHLYHTYHYTEEEREKRRQKAKLQHQKIKEAIEKERGYPMRPQIHRTPEEMKEKHLAYGREYYRKNKSKILEKVRQKQNLETSRAYSKQYYQKNKSKILEKAKQRYHQLP
jgi:hypothetical protein